jgi:hypothetical protein
MLSLACFVQGLFQAAADPLLGLLIDSRGIASAYRLMGAIALIIALPIFLIERRNNGKALGA